MALENRNYTDFDLSFTPHPITGDIVPLNTKDSIAQEMRNLILTMHYERKYRSEIGCNIYHGLSEPNSIITKRALESDIRTVLNKYCLRADVKEVSISDYDDRTYNIIILYEPINSSEPVSVSIIIKRMK